MTYHYCQEECAARCLPESFFPKYTIINKNNNKFFAKYLLPTK